MGNWCGNENVETSMKSTTLPLKRHKTSSKGKNHESLISHIRKLKTKEVKSLRSVDLRMDDSCSESEPSTADSISKKSNKVGQGLHYYDSNKCVSRDSIEVAFREEHSNQDITKDSKCEDDLFDMIQDLEWNSIQREDEILEFKARHENSQVFIKDHEIYELPLITWAQGIPLDEFEGRQSEIKCFVVNMPTQGK